MRIMDLTMPLKKGRGRDEEPGRGVKFELLQTFEKDGWQGAYISMYAHEGTHIDAPLHAVRGGATIDEVPLEELIGRGVLVDLSHKFSKGEAITDEDLEKFGGTIRKGDIPVIRTDQTKKWGQPDFYVTSPYLTRKACEWLVDKKVKANVFDFSIEYSVGREDPDLEPDVHAILLSQNIYNIEYVTNLDKLTQKTFTIVALPLLLVGVEGSPARVIAIENGLSG
jgi:kynurenine formamidase